MKYQVIHVSLLSSVLVCFACMQMTWLSHGMSMTPSQISLSVLRPLSSQETVYTQTTTYMHDRNNVHAIVHTPYIHK
jgi:hypothetical protein